MSARLKIAPRTRHVIEGALASSLHGPFTVVRPEAVDAIMSLEFEVVGVGPNGEQALCAIDQEAQSSEKDTATCGVHGSFYSGYPECPTCKEMREA